MSRHHISAVAAAVLLGLPGAARADTVSAVVLGSADPFLAGQPAGTSCCGGDSAPAQSPTQVTGTLTPGGILTFSAIGSVSYAGGPGPGTADGSGSSTMSADYGTGISGPIAVNLDGLVGVFVGDGVPGGTAPAQLDFSGGLNFASLAPGLGQIFWIGDGLTGTGSGDAQQFVVPTGATRLFLGTVDGFGWYNNSGSFAVTVTGVNAGTVPEPASWAMLLAGFGLVGGALRRRELRLA